MKDKQLDRKQVRTFGIGLLVVLITIAGLQIYWGRIGPGAGLFAVGLVILLLLIFAPAALVPLYKLMRLISRAIGLVMTPIMLGLLFYLVFAPMGILFRLARKDILDRRFNVDADSYWETKEPISDSLHRYERQY
jgi:hypothetical protein|tara:strand:- start:71 stop:475 length:405 start_codon:yes stop_codon:yes gene_type:complete